MDQPLWLTNEIERTHAHRRRVRLATLVGILALVIVIGLIAGCSSERPSQVAVSGVTNVTEDPCELSGCSAPTTHTTSTTVPPSSTTTQATVPTTVATTLPPTTTTAPSVEAAAVSEPVVTAQAEPGSVKAIIYEIFGSEGDYAVRVFTCESNLNPNAVSSTNDHGVAQLNAPTWNRAGTGDPIADWLHARWGSIYDPRTNLTGAKMIRDKYGWDSWACA